MKCEVEPLHTSRRSTTFTTHTLGSSFLHSTRVGVRLTGLLAVKQLIGNQLSTTSAPFRTLRALTVKLG